VLQFLKYHLDEDTYRKQLEFQSEIIYFANKEQIKNGALYESILKFAIRAESN
jgi:hypothetical protein